MNKTALRAQWLRWANKTRLFFRVVILIFIKSLTFEKEKPKAPHKDGNKKKTSGLLSAAKFLFRLLGTSVTKDGKQLVKNARTRNFKTWARVKEDMKNWYENLLNEAKGITPMGNLPEKAEQ
ncbi:hypothetical protein FGM00_11260 [Aggregatimonas sangjinii]|uniref:Uncharacterized protein n=1 Tax=Aggregatimonas sangjinii TaxID=2583587 RepID=A0A5B7SPQ1_9FLAO|nr:hypothetical protein [Aggregatimonas sangjinii]QCX00655.1 hypothetical protein FGM00_11260 [Aggregatimonas sangjinii]